MSAPRWAGRRAAAAALMLCMVPSLPALAATVARSSASLSGTQVPIAQQGSNTHSGEFSSSSAFAGAAGGGSADAAAQLGVLKAYASAFSGAGGAVGHAFAEAAYAENITVSSAGLNGTQAKITFGVTLQGLVDPQGSMGGSVDWSFMGAGFLGGWSAFSSPDFPGGFPVDGVSAVAGGPLFYSNIHDHTMSFTLGSPFTVTERLTASTFKRDCGFNDALCEASAAGSANIDFGHSSYWNGISAISVLDANGQFVPMDLGLFTATSAGGVDMMRSFAPVPEPAAGALLLAGLAGLLGWRSRRRAADARPG